MCITFPTLVTELSTVLSGIYKSVNESGLYVLGVTINNSLDRRMPRRRHLFDIWEKVAHSHNVAKGKLNSSYDTGNTFFLRNFILTYQKIYFVFVQM